MRKHNKRVIFYLCDLVLVIYCFIRMIAEEASHETGLAALESAGWFAQYFLLFCLGLGLLVIVSLIFFVMNRMKKH